MFWRSCNRVIRVGLFVATILATQFAAADASVESANTTAGKAVYSQTCIACHGADGKGTIPGVKDFTTKNGPLTKTDDALLKSITEGFQSPGAPLAMPAKGGNPALTEADIKAVLDYLRAEFGA